MFRILTGISIIFIGKNSFALETSAEQRPKMFLYASRLPSTLKNHKTPLRKHVIDVLLSTQKYNVVFSDIPKFISPADVPQSIIKYKLRTSYLSPTLFNLSFTMINADKIKVIKEINYLDIPKSKLLYQFRLHLYEFILGKKLSNSEEKKFNEISKQRIQKYDETSELSSNTNTSQPTTNKKPELSSSRDFKNKIQKNSPKPTSSKNNPLSSENKNLSSPTLNLWDLLNDVDTDPSWDINNIKNVNNAIDDKNGKMNESETEGIKGPPNPFLKTRISLVENDEELDYRIDMFHFAWRVVKRDQEVTDIIALTNNFFSILGLTFEWVIHNPLNIQNLFFRTGFEVDRSIKTEPIKLSDHSLFRTGFGFKLPFNLLPNIYLETNSLVFANLNTEGEGFQDNIVSVYWSTIELAYLTDHLYLALQYSKSLDSSTLLEGKSFTSLSGTRAGVNARYFSDYTIFSLKLWGDIEYRVEDFSAISLDTKTRNLKVVKQELAIKLGFYF